jgi:hypothetical protein
METQELLWSYVNVKSPCNQTHRPQILNHCCSPSSIHSYPTTTTGFKIRSILSTQKSINPGGWRYETQPNNIPPPPPCNVCDQNTHITIQVTSYWLQLQSPGCAPMAVFVGFLVDTGNGTGSSVSILVFTCEIFRYQCYIFITLLSLKG